jgi:YggT family protein
VIAFILQALAIVAWLIVLGRVLMGWLDPTYSRPLGQFLFSITEPILAPVRRVLPETGMLDLSPLVVLVVLSVVIRLVIAL